MRRLMIVLGAIVLGAVAAPALAGLGPPSSELSWGNNQLYQTTVTRYFNAAAARARVPFYGIGPVDPDNPLDPTGPGCPHYHVIRVPQGNGGEFSANFEFFVVRPTDPAIASGRVADSPCDLVGGLIAAAADLDADAATPLQGLTSVEKIEQAAALGLVAPVDIGVTGVVAVRRLG